MMHDSDRHKKVKLLDPTKIVVSLYECIFVYYLCKDFLRFENLKGFPKIPYSAFNELLKCSFSHALCRQLSLDSCTYKHSNKIKLIKIYSGR